MVKKFVIKKEDVERIAREVVENDVLHDRAMSYRRIDNTILKNLSNLYGTTLDGLVGAQDPLSLLALIDNTMEAIEGYLNEEGYTDRLIDALDFSRSDVSHSKVSGDTVFILSESYDLQLDKLIKEVLDGKIKLLNSMDDLLEFIFNEFYEGDILKVLKEKHDLTQYKNVFEDIPISDIILVKYADKVAYLNDGLKAIRL